MKFLAAVLSAFLLTSCASYSGRDLMPNQSLIGDVQSAMGQPAMRWDKADGSVQLAYPRGPAGYHTYMVRLGADGKLQSIENVLQGESFARIHQGMSKAEVLELLGPPNPVWTVYYQSRDELAWEWRFCDDWHEASRFNVLFDASKEVVRSTLTLSESQRNLCDRKGSCPCSR